MTEIRLPNINGKSEKEQLGQIGKYLYQLAGELNYALGMLTVTGAAQSASVPQTAKSTEQDAETKAQNEFNSVKSLIIKSADIVNAYYEQISKKLVSQYEALSDYGNFKRDTTVTLGANAEQLSALFTNTETIESDLDSINAVLNHDENGTTIIGSEAWVKIGILDRDTQSGFPIYGMEIGQQNSDNGQTVSKKMARYCSDGVHLYDEAGTEVVLITQGMLIITKAQIRLSLRLGDYMLDASDGIAFDYIGG